MELQYKELPFPHVIVDNFYNEEELKDIWLELDFLTSPRKMLPPSETGSAYETDTGAYKKQNYGVFLDSTYTRREMSNILTHYKKIFDQDFMTQLYHKHIIFRYLYRSDFDQSLLSYYENADYYKPHTDSATLTALTWFFREPRKFQGGDLSFEEFNYTVELKNNRFILFPSVIEHSVSQITMDSDVKPMTGYGRYVVSHFIKQKIA